MGFTFSYDIKVSESHSEAIRSRRARTAISRGRPFITNSCPNTHFREPLYLQQKISSFAIKPNLDPEPQLDDRMRIIDIYERVRGVPLQDVDIQDARSHRCIIASC